MEEVVRVDGKGDGRYNGTSEVPEVVTVIEA